MARKNDQIDLWRLSDKRYQLLNQEHSGEWTWYLDVAPDATTPALILLAQAYEGSGDRARALKIGKALAAQPDLLDEKQTQQVRDLLLRLR